MCPSLRFWRGLRVGPFRLFIPRSVSSSPALRTSREANVAPIPLQSANGRRWVADANVEWDKTILPSLGFRVGAAYAPISQDLDHDNPNPDGDQALPSD